MSLSFDFILILFFILNKNFTLTTNVDIYYSICFYSSSFLKIKVLQDFFYLPYLLVTTFYIFYLFLDLNYLPYLFLSVFLFFLLSFTLIKHSRVFDEKKDLFWLITHILNERRESFFCSQVLPSGSSCLRIVSVFIFIITTIIKIIGYFTYFKPLIISLISKQKSKMRYKINMIAE